jgi:nucleotide-binding universal stress UspA family protein
VRTVQSILVLADRSTEAQSALRKASLLARHFRAQIDLFSCDTDHAWAVGLERQSPAARKVLDDCLAESHRYLNALRSSIPAADLRISTSASCAAALPEGVAQRVRDWRPDLVVKNLADGLPEPRPPQALDMQLIQAARVPMLWIRGRAWRPVPKITVALDLLSEDRALTRSVLETAECLALGCHGELTIVHCLAPGSQQTVAGTMGLSDRAQATCDWLGLSPDRLQISTVNPVATFGVGGSHSGMDVLVLGGVQPTAWEQGRPTTTEDLLSVLESDVLLVPRHRHGVIH